jgi:type IV pilus assembly protein PilV
MAERINANPTQAANYLGTFGTGDTQPNNCAQAFPTEGPNRDLCEWSSALKGAAEQSSGANVGGMQGARGCVTQLQAPNPALGVCTAGVYQVAVAWQGLVPTVTPALACGAGSYGGNDSFRRVVATTVSVPTTSCY